MSSAWSATKTAASSSGRSERGFWVYANSTGSSLEFECGTIESGPNVTECETRAGIFPSSSIDQFSSSPLTGGKWGVAYCHTHTPLTYCPSTNRRLVGPTEEDDAAHSQIPGLVYDYDPIYYPDISFSGIRGGHNINADAHMYVVNSTTRRTIY